MLILIRDHIFKAINRMYMHTKNKKDNNASKKVTSANNASKKVTSANHAYKKVISTNNAYKKSN